MGEGFYLISSGSVTVKTHEKFILQVNQDNFVGHEEMGVVRSYSCVVNTPNFQCYFLGHLDALEEFPQLKQEIVQQGKRKMELYVQKLFSMNREMQNLELDSAQETE